MSPIAKGNALIPRIDFAVDADIPVSATFWLPRALEIDEEGFGGFRETWVIKGTPIRYARNVLRAEMRLVEFADRASSNAEEFDQIANAIELLDSEALTRVRRSKVDRAILRELIDEEEGPPLDGLDLGVAGLVYALSAVGFLPAASCRGHCGGRAWSICPVVLFAAKRWRVELLAPMVREFGCGFLVEPDRPNLLAIEAPSVANTIQLAGGILEAARSFRCTGANRSPSVTVTPKASSEQTQLF